MPLRIQLQNVPKDSERLQAYLLHNFRQIEDALARAAEQSGSSDIEITSSSSGVILTSPNGTSYRVTVDDAGTLTTTAV